MATISFNLPLMTLPLYYVLAVVPAVRATIMATGYDPSKMDSSNPNGSRATDAIKKQLSPRDFAAWERAKNCHRNGLENMPLYVAAIFAGLLAEQRAGEGEMGLTTFCVGWMACRVVYTINFLVVETKSWSYIRSAMYLISSIWAMTMIGRSAFVLGN